ncbi:MAG: chitobiase/beta-hexosaminidase C-terminal domain-containing protein [Clostridia bacterium]|nr:chitobiase/beta-hexosaminidase C-terminal domain-containing protein [Clostridia bacterium]
MKKNRILSVFLIFAMLLPLFPASVFAASDDKAYRSVYLHAQGENPDGTNRSTVYMGDTADIYFAVDNPNKGAYEDGIHKEPQFDMNGYTVRICFDPEYFDFVSPNTSAPIDYTVPDINLDTSSKDDENIGSDTGADVPQEAGYFVYKSGSGTYKTGGKTYKTAYITVFFSGGYVPQKKDGQAWYNLAKLPLTPKKTGSTNVFIDIDSGDELYTLMLFAKNKSDELNEQTFIYDAVNGGYHTIIIKDKAKPAPPMADPPAGSYIEKQTVTLNQEDNCKIYYTTDGSDPRTSPARIEYTEPLELTVTTEIKACAYRESDGKYSNTVTFNYTILPDRPYLFDNNKALISDIYSENSKFVVYASDKSIFANISDDSEVYYTFGNADAENPAIGTDPEAEWVKIDKRDPLIEIDKKRAVRLITNKMGEWSEPALYYLSVKPAPVTSNYLSGEYDEKIDVTLSTETVGAKIYYTIDGTDPKSSPSAQEYTDIPITLAKDCTLRAAALYDGEWSEKSSWYYLFKGYDDYGISAFYPSGVYEGSVNVMLMPNNPNFDIMYHTGDGIWKVYDKTLIIDKDTVITAKAVDSEGNEGDEYIFTYKIKPLPPEFAPESTQFTNADTITVYTPESTQDNTSRYEMYYTLDGTDPITSETRIKADEASDSAIINITKYTVVSAAVLKDGESWSTVERHSYDIVTKKPVKPITTLLPGHYTREIGGAGFSTQFMPVPQGTEIYYTVCYDGTLCPDPVPNTEGTMKYDGVSDIEVKGKTVIKAVAVNVFGVKSDIGIFSYTITPEAPVSAPSAAINAPKLPVVPVDAVAGSTVKYTIGDFHNEFVNDDGERFYIDTHTGNAYRDKECTVPLGNASGITNADKAVLEIQAVLDGVESDINRYVYSLSDNAAALTPPYADKATGMYEERKIDDNNNLLAVSLYSLNNGGEIQYRFDNSDKWLTYTDDEKLLLKEDTILQLRYAKDGNYSAVASYVYSFVPLAPVIELPSGRYLESDNKSTKISLDENAPSDKNYSIWYRQNGDSQDFRYTGQERAITHTMSFKAYVKIEDTGRVSRNTINYYIIEKAGAASGSVYIAYPYDTERISADLLGTGDYAEGIKLLTQNKNADIHYFYTYTKKADGQTVTTNTEIYDITRPIIPTALMDDITIYAWLEDENGRIPDSDGIFTIDFIHLNVPVTSLGSEKVEFPKNTKYTLINEYLKDENILLYYTLDGSDPADSSNAERKLYNGEELTLTGPVTVKAVYFSACGKCVECKNNNPSACWYGVYGKTGIYKYVVPTTITTGGGGGGGGGGGNRVVDNSRKYTIDIFGNEHPTHIGYINGYPDGSVQPEGDITREEMTAILYRITNHDYESPFAETGDVFPDVEFGRWSLHDIEYMADKKVVLGYPDGEFKPSRHLTRAEFAALIYRFTEEKLTKIEAENAFNDLSDEHWAYNEILVLCKNGLMEGYEDGTFRCEDNITRAEVMTVINKILGRKPLESYVKSLNFNPYNDLEIDKWYYVIVLEATITHDYYLDDKNGYEYKWESWK